MTADDVAATAGETAEQVAAGGSAALARKLSAVHLVLAGAVNLGSGAALAYLAESGWLVRTALSVVPGEAGSLGALMKGGTVGLLATKGAIAVGFLLIVVAVGQFAVAPGTWRGQRFWSGVAAGVAGTVNPLALPLSFVAVATLAFAGHSESARQSGDS
ncbi:MAG: hypothetical protein ABEJ08_04290 [Halobacteriaceae archaeon]